MNDEQLQTLEQIRQFVEGSQVIEFEGINAREKYRWIEEVLRKFRYYRLKKEGKGLIRRYIMKVTGYSRAQVARLIGKYQGSGKIYAARIPAAPFSAEVHGCGKWRSWQKPMNYMVG